MELIAATRVVKAQERAAEATALLRGDDGRGAGGRVQLATGRAPAKDHPLLRDNPGANVRAVIW